MSLGTLHAYKDQLEEEYNNFEVPELHERPVILP